MSIDENKQKTDEKDNSTLDRSVQVEKILEFYKDKLQDEPTTDDETVTEAKPQRRLDGLLNKLPFMSKPNSEDDIETESFGMTDRGRFVLQCVITAVICIAVIIGSVVLAYFLPGNRVLLEERMTELRNDDEYKSLKSRHDSLVNEIEETKASNEDKKNTIEGISDVDNTKAELRQAISDKSTQLNELNRQIALKQSEIAALDESISSKAAPETVRSPGKYTVGKNIAAGKYYITGTGKFMVASSDGKSKVNTTLGSTPLEISLEQNDIVKFDSKVKFTAIN